jgi:hypothetical protein
MITAGSNTMTTVPIRIDLRPFMHPIASGSTNPLLVLVGPSGEILLTSPDSSVQLAPGGYEVIVGSGLVADFAFTVSPQGTIDFDTRFNAFLGGRGTSTLVVTGFLITFDARYLSGPTTLFVLPDAVTVLNTTLHLLPASAYQMEQGSGSVAQWKLQIGLDGKLHYDPVLDVSRNGFLAGNGTTRLQLFGYPLLVDARASGAGAVVVVPTGNITASATDVTFVNLLPTDNVALQLDSKRVPFIVNLDGSLHVSPALASLVQFDHFHGLPRMTVTRPVP